MNEIPESGRIRLPGLDEAGLKELAAARPISTVVFNNQNTSSSPVPPNPSIPVQLWTDARAGGTSMERRMSSTSAASMRSNSSLISEGAFSCRSGPTLPSPLELTKALPKWEWQLVPWADQKECTSISPTTSFGGPPSASGRSLPGTPVVSRHPGRSPSPPWRGQQRSVLVVPGCGTRVKKAKAASAKPQPHNNFPYRVAGQDFIFYSRVDREMKWDKVTEQYNANRHRLNHRYTPQQKEEPLRDVAGTQGIFYRRRSAGLPLIDRRGHRVLDPQSGFPLMTDEAKQRPEKSRCQRGEQGAVSTLVRSYPERIVYKNYDFISPDDMAMAKRLGTSPPSLPSPFLRATSEALPRRYRRPPLPPPPGYAPLTLLVPQQLPKPTSGAANAGCPCGTRSTTGISRPKARSFTKSSDGGLPLLQLGRWAYLVAVVGRSLCSRRLS